jgi:hypothetical protein
MHSTRSARVPASLALLCLVGLGTLGGCQTQDSVLAIYPELRAALNDFQREKAVFKVKYPTPHQLDFPGAGRVHVREIELAGYPGNAFVRCRFQYRNTTGTPVVRAWVSLDVLDAEGTMVASQVSVLVSPAAEAIGYGNYFSDELRTKTMDAHLQPGWSWRITCKAELEQPDDGMGR